MTINDLQKFCLGILDHTMTGGLLWVYGCNVCNRIVLYAVAR